MILLHQLLKLDYLSMGCTLLLFTWPYRFQEIWGHGVNAGLVAPGLLVAGEVSVDLLQSVHNGCIAR